MCNLYSCKYLLSLKKLNIHPLLSKKDGNKTEYTLSDTAIHCLTMQSHLSYSSCSCFACLTGPYKCVYLIVAVQIRLFEYNSHTGHWMFNMAPHGKELSEDLRIRIVALHKDGLGYKSSVTAWN